MNVELSKGINYTSYYNNMYGKTPMFILNEDIAAIEKFDYDLPSFDPANMYREKEIVPQTLKQQILIDQDLAIEDKIYIKDCIYNDNILIRYNTDESTKDYVIYTFNFTGVNENLKYISLDKISSYEENPYAYTEQVCHYVVDQVKIQIEETYANLKNYNSEIEFEITVPGLDKVMIQLRYIKDKRDASCELNAEAVGTTYAVITRAPELFIWKDNIYSGEDILYSQDKQDILWGYFLDNKSTIFCGIKPIKRTKLLNYANKKLKFYNVPEYAKTFTVFENIFSNLFLTLVDYKEVNDLLKDGNDMYYKYSDMGGHVRKYAYNTATKIKQEGPVYNSNLIKHFLDPYQLLLEYSYRQVTQCENNNVTFNEANNKLQPTYCYSRILSKLSIGNVSSNIHSLVNLCFISGLDITLDFSKDAIVSLIVPIRAKETNDGFVTKIISNVNILSDSNNIAQAYKDSLRGELAVNNTKLIPLDFGGKYDESIKQLVELCKRIYIGFTNPGIISMENNYNEWQKHSLYDAYKLKDTQKLRPIIYTKYACGFLYEGIVLNDDTKLKEISRECTVSYLRHRKLMESNSEKNLVRNMVVDDNVSYVGTRIKNNKMYDVHTPFTFIYGLTVDKISRKDLGTSSRREALNNWLLKRTIVGTFILDDISDTDVLNSDFTKDSLAEKLYSDFYYEHDRDLVKEMEEYIDINYRAGKIDEVEVHDWFKLIDETKKEMETTPNKFYIDIGLQTMNKVDLNFTQRITLIPGEDYVKVNNFIGEFKVDIQNVRTLLGEDWEHLFSTLLTPIDFVYSTQKRLIEYYV